MNRKHLYWIIPSSLAVILVALYFLLPVFAKTHIQRKIKQFETERSAEVALKGLHIGLLNIHGEMPVSLQSMTLRRKKADDTLLYLVNAHTTVQIFNGLHRTTDLLSFSSDTIALHLIHNDNYRNYEFPRQFPAHTTNNTHAQHNYKKLTETLLQSAERFLPRTMGIGTFALNADIQDQHYHYTIPNLLIENGTLRGTLTERCKTAVQSWEIEGSIDHAARSYCATITALDKPSGFAITNELTEAELGFQQLSVSLSHLSSDDTTSKYCLRAEAVGLLLNHLYLATQTVTIDSAAARLQLTLSPTRLIIDSTSVLLLNQTELHPFLCYESTAHAKPHITFEINETGRDASQLFGSIPDGLLQVIPDLKLTGKMDFGLRLDCDFRHVDSLDFDFFLGSRDRTLAISGDLNRINRFNSPFEYVFFENGDTVRTVTIGPANPHFCPFDQIPP